MVTAIAGLESGVINTNTKINDTGIYTNIEITNLNVGIIQIIIGDMDI